jgi:hypothetical protein
MSGSKSVSMSTSVGVRPREIALPLRRDVCSNSLNTDLDTVNLTTVLDWTDLCRPLSELGQQWDYTVRST